MEPRVHNYGHYTMIINSEDTVNRNLPGYMMVTINSYWTSTQYHSCNNASQDGAPHAGWTVNTHAGVMPMH